MRILFLASYFPQPANPVIGTWALEQAKALARVAELRVVCMVPCIPSLFSVWPRARSWAQIPDSYRWDNVSVDYLKALYYPMRPFKGLAYRNPHRQLTLAWRSIESRMLRIVKAFAPDILYAHHTDRSGFLASQVHKHTGLPYIVTDHDFSEVTDCEKLPRRRAFFDEALRNVYCSVSVSHRMERDFHRVFPTVRTVTIHNGINPIPAGILAQPRAPALRGKTIISSVGMFTPRKGFPLLVEAFARVAPRHPDAILRIAGVGEQRPRIESEIRTHSLQGRVELLGLLPHHDVLQEIAWSDFFALAAWDEPFGVVFAEAMGAGKPVIAASDGGITDVIRDGEHGLIVPPREVGPLADALDRLLSDAPARSRMGQAAKALVDGSLTWDANSRRMLEIFAEARATRSPAFA